MSRNRARLGGLVLATLLAAAGSRAEASLIGREFSASYRIPTLGDIYDQAVWAPATFTVGVGTETTGLVEGVTSIATDFGTATLTLTLTTTLSGPRWNSTVFNGPVFAATLPHGIAAATVNAATTLAGFDDSRISLTGTEIRLDWGGLSYTSGSVVALDFVFVPEPAGLAVLGIAVAGLAAVGRRRRPVLAGA